MKDPFATSNKVGLPLTAPSIQTILPVLCGGVLNSSGELVQGHTGINKILGWLPIVETTFAGTERTFATADGAIPITTVTLPAQASDGTAETYRVGQYMAAIFPEDQERLFPWLGYTDFIDISQSQYLMQWIMPTQGQIHRLSMGPLLTDLTIRMNADAGASPMPVPPPDVTPGTLRWVCSMTMNDLQAHCGFIDFNWVNLFAAQTDGIDPLRIEIVSNPPTGEFKTTIVPFPVTAPLGGVEFNTLRIIKLQSVTPGPYVFNYAVFDTAGQSTPVTLTITVV